MFRSTYDLGKFAHFEDIAVAKDQKGNKIGLRVLEALIYLAKQVGCYKVWYHRQAVTRLGHWLTNTSQVRIVTSRTKVSTASVRSRKRGRRWC